MSTSVNRLAYTYCYTSGAIDCDREGGKQWRKEIGQWLNEKSIIDLNPYEKYELFENAGEQSVQQRQLAKENRDWKLLQELMRPVVNFDLRCCDLASFLIFRFDVSIYSCGSYDEIFTSDNQKKPVLVLTSDLSQLPDWLFGRLNYHVFFDDINKLKDYLTFIDSGPEEDVKSVILRDKWKLFDNKKLFKKIISKEEIKRII